MYNLDDSLTIVNELERIRSIGFQIVCIPFMWDADLKSNNRIKTDTLLDKAAQLNLKVYVRYPWDYKTLQQYLTAYGNKIHYLQVINEADAMLLKTWNVPSELTSIAQKNAEVTKAANPNIKTVATFCTPFIPTLVSDIASHVDIVGIDIYEKIELQTFPALSQPLLTLSNKKNLWVSEFGYASLDDEAQSNFIKKGLEMFSKSDVEVVIVWCWKHTLSLNIKNRPAETAIKEWIGH